MFLKYKVYIIIGGVILIILLLFAFKSCGGPTISPVPGETIEAVKAELEAQYKSQLEAKTTEVNINKKRLFESEARYQVLNGKYEKLRKDKEDVKPPITNSETRERFIAAGFTPIPITGLAPIPVK